MKILMKSLVATCAGLLLSQPLMAQSNTDEFARVKSAEIAQMMTKMSGAIPGQWRVTWTGDTSTTATVSWTTLDAGKKHILHYGTKSGGKDPSKYEHHLEVQKNGNYSIKAKDVQKGINGHFHHAELTGLTPDTKYYFLIESDGNFTRPLYFKTAPVSGDVKLIVGGDSRSGVATRCKVNLMMKELVEKDPEIIGFVHGGDYVNSGPSWGQWRMWMSNNELTTGDDGRVLPIIPTRGNHDGGPLFFEVFNLPKDRADLHFWHTTQVTKDISIVTLDTNVSAKGPQEEWLQQELERERKSSRWLLTNYHRPMFPAVKTPADHAPVFVPLFEQYNVDMGLESDGHAIKRTVPIRDGKKDPTGIVYIGEGGLGVGQRTPKKDLWYFDGGYVGKGHHIMTLDFTDTEITVKTILLGGEVVDKVTVPVRK